MYAIRRESDRTFMFGDSLLTVDENSDATLRIVTWEGTERLLESLTWTNVDLSLVRSIISNHSTASGIYQRALER